MSRQVAAKLSMHLKMPISCSSRRFRRIMPEEAAGSGDFFKNLIPGQFADDVAARRASEFTTIAAGQPLVIAVAPATPLGKAVATVLTPVDRLVAQMTQYIAIEGVAAGARRRATAKKHVGMGALFGERFMAGADVAIRGKAEIIL